MNRKELKTRLTKVFLNMQITDVAKTMTEMGVCEFLSARQLVENPALAELVYKWNRDYPGLRWLMNHPKRDEITQTAQMLRKEGR
jgi:hypothetical protein